MALVTYVKVKKIMRNLWAEWMPRGSAYTEHELIKSHCFHLEELSEHPFIYTAQSAQGRDPDKEESLRFSLCDD